MTKTVRIENADGSDHKLVVEVWVKQPDGIPDRKQMESGLYYPTDLKEFLVHDGQYLVVREGELEPI